MTSDDLAGLRLMRERAPPAMDVAAGEYVYDLDDARACSRPSAVDVLQADVTRCGGVTGFLHIGGPVRGASHRSLRSLRAGASSARRLRRSALAASRMVSRPRPDRADAVRRRARVPRTARSRPTSRGRDMGLEFKAADAERFRIARNGMKALSLIGGDAVRRPCIPRQRSPPADRRPSARRKRADGFGARRATAASGRGDARALRALPTAGWSIIAARSRTRRCTLRSSSASLALASALDGASDRAAPAQPLRDGSTRRGGDRPRGHRLPRLQHRQAAGRLSRGKISSTARRSARPSALTLAGFFGGCAERVARRAAASRRVCSASPAGPTIGGRRAAGPCWAQSAKRACCTSAAPTRTRRCSLPVTLAAGRGRVCWRDRGGDRSAPHAAGPRLAGADRGARRRRRRLPCLRRPPQHGRLAQLEPERAERPALPAPPSFTGLALAGLAALGLMEDGQR